MKIVATSLGSLTLAATLGLVAAQDRPAQDPAPATTSGGAQAPAGREPDVRAISDLLASFVGSYNARDARALGELFTPEAEVEGEDGDVAIGREAIVARFGGTFEGGGGGTLSVEAESLRFLGTDVAVEEGTATLSAGEGASPRTNRYSVTYARQGGRWLHARIRDEPEEEIAAHDRLRELEWLLGEWVNESDDEVVFTTCKWSDDGNFLLRDFDVKVEGRIALKGSQRIGWDGQRGQFRMWVFDDGGGFADGLLARDDDRWVIRGTGVRPDGKAVSFTTAMTPLGRDRLRWEVLDRSVGDEVVPGTDQFDLVRRPPAPAN